MMRETHSEKGLKTLDLMGTKPDQWAHIPIKWVKEIHKVPTRVDCPLCGRLGRVHIEADGRVAANEYESLVRQDYRRYNDRYQARRQAIRTLPQDTCPLCPPRRNFRSYGTGQIVWNLFREVEIGYLQTSPGTLWDSRFADNGRRCHLCDKVIRKSLRVPVHGKGDDGVVHGMWVGQDCARKFLGVKSFENEDRFIADNLGGAE